MSSPGADNTGCAFALYGMRLGESLSCLLHHKHPQWAQKVQLAMNQHAALYLVPIASF